MAGEGVGLKYVPDFSFMEALANCWTGGEVAFCVNAGVAAGLEMGAWRTVCSGSWDNNEASCCGVMTLESVRNSSS